MSLNRIAARICAVQALRGRTLVGDNVLDSQISALDVDGGGHLITNQRKPFISIYCESSTLKGNSPERGLRGMVPNGTTDFLFETGVAATMTEVDPGTEQSYVVPGLPATDENFEFKLDIVMRQISDCLMDPDNEWAAIFRTFCRQTLATERNRTSSDQNARMAAHQLKMTVDLWPDPDTLDDMKPAHPLAMFFTKVDAVGDNSLSTQADLMKACLSKSGHDWQRALRRYGMTFGEAEALLLTTPVGAEADVAIDDVVVAPAVPVGG